MTRTFWRLSASRSVATAFQGTRGRGRWNTPATHPVYAASSVALAALERLLYAQFDTRQGAFEVHHLFHVVIPDGAPVDRIAVDRLPPGWAEMASPVDPTSPPTPLQAIGDAWARRRASVALIVPSAHAWEETNALLNPVHPDFPRLVIEYVRPYRFDHRFAVKRRTTSRTEDPYNPHRDTPPMAVVPGTRVGPYEITAQIGAGGMGEVYQISPRFMPSPRCPAPRRQAARRSGAPARAQACGGRRLRRR